MKSSRSHNSKEDKNLELNDSENSDDYSLELDEDGNP